MSGLVVSSLTADEDTFAMAVVECGGNIAAAYRSVWPMHKHPLAAGRELLSRPEIAKRVAALQNACDQDALISIGAHMGKLAEIRDLAMTVGQPKAALDAEVARGTVAGFYKKEEKGQTQGGAAVHIHLGVSTPANAVEWSKQFGVGPPVVIEQVERVK